MSEDLSKKIDFEYAIDKLITNTNPAIYLQGDILNSEYMNNTFTEIETTLNTLYEKTRYLEDSIAYVKAYLQEEINTYTNIISSITEIIDNNIESAKNLSYISHPVPFAKNTNVVLDRGGSSLIHPLVIRNKVLTLDYETYEDQSYDYIKSSSTIPYMQNEINNLKYNVPYRAVFLEEKPVQGGVVESIYIGIEEQKEVNLLEIIPVNCHVKNLRFGLINGVEEFVGDYTPDMTMNTRMCKYIKFDLVCKHYDVIEYTLDKNVISTLKDRNDVWSYVKNFEYYSGTTKSDEINKHNLILSKTVKDGETGEKTTTAYASSENKQTTTLTMFSYIHGINSLAIKNCKHYTDGYYISDPITIGDLKQGEYIRLHVQQQKNDCCEISYSILDGDIEKPIMIMEEDIVENELIFNNANTRFEMDFDTGSSFIKEVIKKDGAVVEMSYIDAKDNSKNGDNRYCITYKPGMDHYNCETLMNKTIQIKCYIRTYGKVKNIPYISNISIRKYGEESLWINRL